MASPGDVDPSPSGRPVAMGEEDAWQSIAERSISLVRSILGVGYEHCVTADAGSAQFHLYRCVGSRLAHEPTSDEVQIGRKLYKAVARLPKLTRTEVSEPVDYWEDNVQCQCGDRSIAKLGVPGVLQSPMHCIPVACDGALRGDADLGQVGRRNSPKHTGFPERTGWVGRPVESAPGSSLDKKEAPSQKETRCVVIKEGSRELNLEKGRDRKSVV